MIKELDLPEPEERFPFIKPISAERFLDLILPGMPKEEKAKLARQAEEMAADKHKCTMKEAEFRSILNKIGRPGTEQMLKELKKLGFFEAPASVDYHSNWKGGLLDHSLKVYECAMELRTKMLADKPRLESQLDTDSVAIAALLHDVCKADEYCMDGDGNPMHAQPLFPIGGHGDKSLIRLLMWGYKLDQDEMLVIRWHMGENSLKAKPDIKSCQAAKRASALSRLIIQADHMAATA